MKRVIVVLAAVAVVAAALIVLAGPSRPPAVSADIVGLQAANNDAGFVKADRVHPFTFPLDHGPHPDYQTEWWYYTGNLTTSSGRRFGFQLTFFRRAITATPVDRASDWGTNQIYFAHMAVTDVQNDDHFAVERFSRGAVGLAGATGVPYKVWLENWSVTALDPAAQSVQLSAEDSQHALYLTLSNTKPPALNGDAGLSPKSAQAGNASYYYSLTRLTAEGTVQVNGETFAVKGLGWMDHEFGTTMLGPDAVGWDWFSVQLSDRREVMFFQIRLKDGGIEPVSGGTLVDPDGTTHHLTLGQVQVQVLGTWTSTNGAVYPSHWKIDIPSAGMDLDVKPYVADQEMRLSIAYWEGAVAVSGRSNGAPADGSGYVELTGYAQSSQVPR